MSLPEPRPGLVIAYDYLWAMEAIGGRDAGNKTRPCVVVVTTRREGGKTVVVVAPITHTPPGSALRSVILPAPTKNRLGLDDQPSWIIADDLNQFTWPGFDLQTIRRGSNRHDYGVLPASLLIELKSKVLRLVKAGEVGLTTRD